MEQRSEHLEFLSTPNRQSPVAIILILLKFVQIIIKQAWPVLLVFLIRPGGSDDSWLAWLTIGIAGLSAILSIIAYFKFYFYVREDELIIEKGVLQKSKLNIPMDRIQTVNFKQNIIHQLFGVVSLELDTAGSKGNEFSITALTQDRASALREFLISKKKSLSPEADPKQLEQEELLLKLEPIDLLKIGVGQNHLRTVAVILGTLFGFYQYLEEAMGEEIVEGLRSFFGFTFESIFWSLLLITPLLFLVAFLISLVNTVLRHYDLSFIKTSLGFKIISGLLTRKERSANLQKIQIIQWSRNPIKRIFGLYDIRLSQATSSVLSRKQSIYVPGSYIRQVAEVREAYLPGEKQIQFESHRINKAIIGRRVLYLGLLPGLLYVSISFLNFGWSWNMLWALVWIGIVYYSSRIYFKKWRYELSEQGLRTHRGILGEKATLLKWYKVQSVRTRQSLYQRRKKLADLYFSTAGGTVRIPYVEMEKAEAIKNFVLYKIETDRRKWM